MVNNRERVRYPVESGIGGYCVIYLIVSATVQLQIPCTGCREPSSFTSDRYAAVCKGKK